MCWDEAYELGRRHGYRNGQVTVIAPTGTIGFMMDCDTTGIEPDIALVKYKQLAGGGMLKIVNQTVPLALRTLGYDEPEIESILAYIDREDTIEGAADLKPEHLPVFDCAFTPRNGTRSIRWQAHVLMMAPAQPFLSGAISKTVNMPRDTTTDDIAKAYFDGWKLGLKALAIYRDNCKVGQPLSNAKAKKEVAEPERVIEYRPMRKRLPKKRPSSTVSYTVGGAKGYLTASSYPDDGLGEVWIEGELSNCRIWNTGHLYFTLKDAGAQLSAVLFRFFFDGYLTDVPQRRTQWAYCVIALLSLNDDGAPFGQYFTV